MTLPSVKQQIERWSGHPAKDAETPQRETLDRLNLNIVCRVGRSLFATTQDKREFKLKGPARPEQIEQAPADAILVHQPVRAADGRTRIDTYIGTPVEFGTGEKVQRRKTYRPKERRPGPIDGLAELRNPASRQPVSLDSSDDGSLEAVAMGALSKRPLLLMTDGRDVPATVRRLIEVVNGAGANLRYHKGHTLADWTHVHRWRSLLVAAWPLVDAHLAGAPLLCAYEHKGAPPLADTLDPVGNPTCNLCVGMEPDAA